jgi:hypothetical protein
MNTIRQVRKIAKRYGLTVTSGKPTATSCHCPSHSVYLYGHRPECPLAPKNPRL